VDQTEKDIREVESGRENQLDELSDIN